MTDACVEPVRNLSEATGTPPISERDMIITVSSHRGHQLSQTGNPIKFASGHYHAKTAGTPAGFHNDEILRNLGYPEEKLDLLKNEKLI